MARWWQGRGFTGAALLSGLLLLGPAPASQAAAGSSPEAESTVAPSSSRQKQLADHLKQVGAIFYGAWWCPHCNTQKDLFGVEAIELLPYVECDKDEPGRKRCMDAKVRAYPTWVLKGERREGVMSLEELESWSQFPSSAQR
jgi:hypothetical protein